MKLKRGEGETRARHKGAHKVGGREETFPVGRVTGKKF